MESAVISNFHYWEISQRYQRLIFDVIEYPNLKKYYSRKFKNLQKVNLVVKKSTIKLTKTYFQRVSNAFPIYSTVQSVFRCSNKDLPNIKEQGKFFHYSFSFVETFYYEQLHIFSLRIRKKLYIYIYILTSDREDRKKVLISVFSPNLLSFIPKEKVLKFQRKL